MKTIILTASTGHGHISAAYSIREILESRQMACEVIDTLSFLGKDISELISNALVNIAVKTPGIFGFMYQAGDALSSEDRKSPVYYANSLYADKLHEYMTGNGFDTAVCTHLFPAEALSYLKREHDLKARCFFVSTDYTCIPFLEELEMDGIFIPHDDLKPQFRDRGISGDILMTTGIPVESKFLTKLSKAEARKKIGIPENIPAFLVMTGGEGGGNALKLTEKLTESTSRPMRVLILTGRNEKLRNSLNDRFKDDERVFPIDFTENVGEHMDACDVLLTKPGGITSTEAAVRHIPMVHTFPIPGVETENARFFSRHGMSILAKDEHDAAGNAHRLAGDKKAMDRMREAQKQYVNPHAAEDICEMIMEKD